MMLLKNIQRADQIISDNPNDKQNSIYSRAAASERKIEIQSVDIIRGDNQLSTILTANELIYNVGLTKQGTDIKREFILKNIGEQTVVIDEVVKSSDAVSFNIEKTTLEPGETMSVSMTFKTDGLKGHSTAKVELKYNGVEKGLELNIVVEVE